MLKAHGRRTPPNMHPTYIVLTVHLMHLTTPYPINRDDGLKSCLFYVFSKDFFFTPVFHPPLRFCKFPFQRSHRTPLTLRRILIFWVQVCFSNLFCVVGLFECLCCWRHPTGFCDDFWVFGLRSLGFVPGGL